MRNTTKNQRKGSWGRDEVDTLNEQTVHQTSLKADNIKLQALAGNIQGEALRISTQNLGMYAENDIIFNGVTAINTYSATSDFWAEGWRLARGTSRQKSVVENYVASDFSVKNQTVIGSNGNVSLTGVKLASGDIHLKSNAKTTFSAARRLERYELDDRQHFWGGIAGSKSVGTARNETRLLGSDITANNRIYLESQKGVEIVGSRVISGGDGYVISKQGDLNLYAMGAENTREHNVYVGTVFNIPQARENAYEQVVSNQSSTLKSQSNLSLATDKNLTINGAVVEAAGLLDIVAKSRIAILAAKDNRVTNTNETGIIFNATATKPVASIDVKPEELMNVAITASSKEENAPLALLHKVKDKAKTEVSATLSAGVYHHSNKEEETKHNVALVAGKEIFVLIISRLSGVKYQQQMEI